ncbi:MAG: hypothetical protein ACRBCI_02570 [Cellvibrionaceae bacterium]
MHIIILVALILLVFFFALQHKRKSTQQAVDPSKQSSFPQKIAFISKGKLFYQNHEKTHELQSPYIQGVIDKIERSKEINAWKQNTSLDTSFTGKEKEPFDDRANIKFVSAEFITPNKLLYFLADDRMGGLFEFDFTEQQEKRLLHKQNLFYQSLSYNNNSNKLLFSQQYQNGIANIGISATDGSNIKELTGGDTLDSAPCWVQDTQDQILFQSSGLARGEHGNIIAYGPSSIMMLDLSTQEISPVLEHSNFDFISPKVAQHGDLYFIRRPYTIPNYSYGNAFIDLIALPFRLLRTLFHYLNFMSLVYSEKPLTSASGPKVTADLKNILLKGKQIDAEKALRTEKRIQGVPSLVPKSWQLIRKTRSGKEMIIAENVASFYLTDEDIIIYSNGIGIFEANEECHNVLARDKLINEICVETKKPL